MKYLLLLFLFSSVILTSHAQLIARVQMDEPLEGICDNDNVYSLFRGWTGQVPPKCSESKRDMEAMINANSSFLKKNPKFKTKGMVGVFINCEGEVVEWDISNKSKNTEFDEELLTLFENFENWKVGTLDGEGVDARELFSYIVKKGVLTIN